MWLFNKPLHKARLKAAKTYFADPTTANGWLVYLFTIKNEKLDRLLDEVCRIAAQKGLKFKRPEIRMVCEGIREIRKRRVSGQIVGRVAGKALGGELIMIFAKCLDEFSDMELAVTVAHELGHIIDEQMQRTGHPFFEAIKHLDLDRETFADAVAAYLYSKLVVITTSKKCGFPLNEGLILRLNLDV